MKRVMMVDMFGRKLVVEYHPGDKYEYRVYDLITPYRKHHLDSFESFQEALEFVTFEIYS